jgi:hypothetical protein
LTKYCRFTPVSISKVEAQSKLEVEEPKDPGWKKRRGLDGGEKEALRRCTVR